jgi:hypothetical protein
VAETDKGSETAECDFSFAGRALRLIVRRKLASPGDFGLSHAPVSNFSANRG